MSDLLSISKVSVEFGGRVILRDLCATLRRLPTEDRGQVVGFLGPSGCGKTTLFRIIAGLDRPTSGTVVLNDKPVEPGDVGVVAQNYPLFAHRTVLSNLLQATKDVAAVHQRLAAFDLNPEAHMYPAPLSGGQRQRVAILQMLLSGAKFLLMDEPFSGLDLIMLEKTCQTIVDAAQHGCTIIVVTHDITSAAAISDHLWLLGHERDAQNQPIPGARVVQTYDMEERGLRYEPDIILKPEFLATVAEIKERFRSL